MFNLNDSLYSKSVTCLYCNNKFTTYKVRTNKTKLIKRDSDFCPYYEGENPLYYDVNVCPECGFSFTESFAAINDQGKYETLKEKFIDKINTNLNLTNERNTYDALNAYKLAIYSATLLNEDDLIIANLGLRIAWIYRFLKKREEEHRFIKNVLDIYYDIYQNEDLERMPMDKYLLIYLIGDLSGRLGEIDRVSKWFSIIIEDRAATPRVVKLTKDRWQYYRELIDKSRKIQ